MEKSITVPQVEKYCLSSSSVANDDPLGPSNPPTNNFSENITRYDMIIGINLTFFGRFVSATFGHIYLQICIVLSVEFNSE